MPQASAESYLSLQQILLIGWWDFTKNLLQEFVSMAFFTWPILLVFGLLGLLPAYLVLSFIGVVVMMAVIMTQESGKIYGKRGQSQSQEAETDGGTKILDLGLHIVIIVSIGSLSLLLLATILVGFAGSLVPGSGILGLVLSIWFPILNYEMGKFDKRLRISYTGSGLSIRLLQLVGIIDRNADLNDVRRAIGNRGAGV